ncbi:uncharacterized protein BDR25DRAFT_269356 [Lindgomyces ingoldianus]|uniref:Uncharacterized protein n=1 Tax=Lindgomyces ingoldianus TaxID=673940 RepID=A0ACB6QI43_9PLEO|nr:uncharacterized protein BDR25DRAFT_269356 [Lindgomyces ingoldianus]KAF2466180.1 hypothetical protein BDR25DRAFT_269356 [Lindgomyces ingoldianus]
MSTSFSVITVESSTLYVIGTCLILLRIISRRLTLGSFSNLQLDDWLMIFILVPFTGTIVCANEVARHESLLGSDKPDVVWGLKMRFALEEFQITSSWLVKACLLILYRRIFPGGKERRYLDWTSAYCLLTYLIIQILQPLLCSPVQGYWNMSPTTSQCSTYHAHSIITLFFDTTTILTVLIFPIPMIPTPRKLLLAILLAFGAVVLITAILGRYYVIIHSSNPMHLLWYGAEATGIICFANLPFLNSLITSTTSPSRIRHISSNLTQTPWPRSFKPTSSGQALRSNSTTTTRSLARVEFEDEWSNCSVIPSSTPLTPIHTLRPTDPPPELGDYWQSRQLSSRDADIERALRPSPQP